MQEQYKTIFTHPLKSHHLKRGYKKMKTADIGRLKEALLVIMDTLESSPLLQVDQTGSAIDETPSADTHFCKNTHRLVKKFKAQQKIEPVDGIVDNTTWDILMKVAKLRFIENLDTNSRDREFINAIEGTMPSPDKMSQFFDNQSMRSRQNSLRSNTSANDM